MTIPLDPNLYPASYRASVWRGSLRILGFMTVVVIGLLARTHVIGQGGPLWLLVFITLLLVFLLLTLVNNTFARIILYPDSIERVTWFGTRTVLRADVVKLERRRGFLFFKSFNLVSKKGLFLGVQLPSGIETDAAWDAWMEVAQEDDAVLTRSAVLHVGRITMIVMTLLVALGCLIAAFVMHVEVERLATEMPVTATVAKVRSRMDRGQRIYSAQLIFDRKQSDGAIIHCDVPDVQMGPTTVGAMIKIAPRNTTCWQPDIICETCALPSDALALDMLIVAAVSGLIFFLLLWISWGEKKKLSDVTEYR
jgi:hypothetical protein